MALRCWLRMGRKVNGRERGSDLDPECCALHGERRRLYQRLFQDVADGFVAGREGVGSGERRESADRWLRKRKNYQGVLADI